MNTIEQKIKVIMEDIKTNEKYYGRMLISEIEPILRKHLLEPTPVKGKKECDHEFKYTASYKVCEKC